MTGIEDYFDVDKKLGIKQGFGNTFLLFFPKKLKNNDKKDSVNE
jgi:hypothetical protein